MMANRMPDSFSPQFRRRRYHRYSAHLTAGPCQLNAAAAAGPHRQGGVRKAQRLFLVRGYCRQQSNRDRAQYGSCPPISLLCFLDLSSWTLSEEPHELPTALALPLTPGLLTDSLLSTACNIDILIRHLVASYREACQPHPQVRRWLLLGRNGFPSELAAAASGHGGLPQHTVHLPRSTAQHAMGRAPSAPRDNPQLEIHAAQFGAKRRPRRRPLAAAAARLARRWPAL